jgi:LCP family protein required for cell wall assembly
MKTFWKKHSRAAYIALALFFVILFGVIAGKQIWGQEQTDDTSRSNTGKSIAWKEQPFLCYISGIEGKKVLQDKDARYSDVNLLAAVNPLSHEILLVNTPRDTLLSVPDVAKAGDDAGEPEKLDAMPLYGKKASQKALENLYGVKVDCYVKVHYSVLKKVVDALGGVTVYSETDFSTDWGPSFQKGDNQVNGKQALAFARERHHLSDGDIQRGKNQQYLLQAIIQELKKPENITAYPKIYKIVKKGVRTNLSKKSLKKLMRWQMTDSESWKIKTCSLEGEASAQVTNSSDGQEIYALLPDSASAEKIAKKIDKILSHTRGD